MSVRPRPVKDKPNQGYGYLIKVSQAGNEWWEDTFTDFTLRFPYDSKALIIGENIQKGITHNELVLLCLEHGLDAKTVATIFGLKFEEDF